MQTRRTLFALSMIALVVAGWLAAPAAEAEPLECSATAETPEPVETARNAPIDPEIEAQSCSITLTCPVGDVIGCSDANNNCSSGNYWVECGGNRTYCPPCLVATECKYGQPEVSCWSQVGDCHVDYLFGVTCDGTYHPCGQSPPQ